MENKWILCVKTFIPVLKPVVLTEEEKTADTPPTKKPEVDYEPRWTPLGLACGIPTWWDTQQYVTDVVKIIVSEQPELRNNIFVACLVKYVPNEVKSYKQNWKDKYVKEEIGLKIETKKNKGEALFNDESKININ